MVIDLCINLLDLESIDYEINDYEGDDFLHNLRCCRFVFEFATYSLEIKIIMNWNFVNVI